MVLNTVTVGAAVTPTVVRTYISHYLNRKHLRQKPTAHISYHEGLQLIRQFLDFASHHAVEELQAFTAQWVPHPRWVKVDHVTIPQDLITKAADTLIAQLGEHGVNKIGGREWWQWRLSGHELQAEWIEMRNDYNARKKNLADGRRIMLYVHGGAYFFGSTDEHRYQMQRHARKLRARVLAPRYRLAPQYPFPCGLLDCLAAYVYLLTTQDPTDIIFAGDSAGGGMVVSLLVILRDQGLPLPAGAILISPWVDLTHSFPSLSGPGDFDYIPAHGFMQKPSAAWPPPNEDEMEAMYERIISQKAGAALPRKSTHQERKAEEESAVQGFALYHHALNGDPGNNPHNPAQLGDEDARAGNRIPGPGHQLSIKIDGNMIQLKDQIQMYTTNQLISHPLVSPVLQPSLGGLPPLLILTGGGELLRDEQIYLAHKAANPAKYPPGDAYMDEYDPDRKIINVYKPTDVQLQVWDDLCHVAPTLSFTRPAKFMYRSVAQFGAWALARAQKTSIDILDDDDVSIISSGSATSSEGDLTEKKKPARSNTGLSMSTQVGRAGDPLPPFRNHMIRQRVDRHGDIWPLAPATDLPALQVPPAEVGVIKVGPVKKWMSAKRQWDNKYSAKKRRIQKQRIKDMMQGNEGFEHGEVPPPSALAGRRKRGEMEEKTKKKTKKSYGLMMWSLWGSHHDESTLKREEMMDGNVDQNVDATTTTGDAEGTETTTTRRPRAKSGAATLMPHSSKDSADVITRSRSRRRAVTDVGQTSDETSDDKEAVPSTAHYRSDGFLAPNRTTNSTDQESLQMNDQTQSSTNNEAKQNGPRTNLSNLTNKHLASLRSPTATITNPETSSMMTSSTFATNAQSDNMSTTAVFAAPGVMHNHSRKGTLSSLNSSSLSQAPNDDSNGQDGDTETENSRRGSLVSVERLRGHQVGLKDGEGETFDQKEEGTNGNGSMTNSIISSNQWPRSTNRNHSTVAVMDVEGVMKKTPGSAFDIDTRNAGAASEEILEVPKEEEEEGAGNADRRPAMPARDEFVTAQEI